MMKPKRLCGGLKATNNRNSGFAPACLPFPESCMRPRWSFVVARQQPALLPIAVAFGSIYPCNFKHRLLICMDD